MTTVKPNLAPCSDVHNGVKDRSRYEELELPTVWTAARLESLGPWIGPDEYFWTPDGFFEVLQLMTPELLCEIRAKTFGCFYNLSLTEQCSLLGVKYQKLHPADMDRACTNPPLKASDSVEKFSFDFFKNQGWAGDLGEGASIHLLAHILRKRLEAQGVRYHNLWYRSLDKSLFPNGIYKRDSIKMRESELIDHEVGSVLEQSNLVTAYDMWSCDPRSFPVPRKLSPETFTLDQLLAVCGGLAKPDLISIINLHVMGYMGMGWPDLTLQKDTALNFVEVKQSQDKFTHRQAYWIRNYAIPLGLDFTVLHVTPSIKVGLRTRIDNKTK
ncbi:MAG: hypothetical protein ACHP7O_02080 [Burkholderiales bacterium]